MNADVSWLTVGVLKPIAQRRAFQHEPHVKTPWLQRLVLGMGLSMAVQRKRFRIEEFQAETGELLMPGGFDGDIVPFQREIINELRAIRAQMGSSHTAGVAASNDTTVSKQSEEAKI